MRNNFKINTVFCFGSSAKFFSSKLKMCVDGTSSSSADKFSKYSSTCCEERFARAGFTLSALRNVNLWSRTNLFTHASPGRLLLGKIWIIKVKFGLFIYHPFKVNNIHKKSDSTTRVGKVPSYLVDLDNPLQLASDHISPAEFSMKLLSLLFQRGVSLRRRRRPGLFECFPSIMYKKKIIKTFHALKKKNNQLIR